MKYFYRFTLNFFKQACINVNEKRRFVWLLVTMANWRGMMYNDGGDDDDC